MLSERRGLTPEHGWFAVHLIMLQVEVPFFEVLIIRRSSPNESATARQYSSVFQLRTAVGPGISRWLVHDQPLEVFLWLQFPHNSAYGSLSRYQSRIDAPHLDFVAVDSRWCCCRWWIGKPKNCLEDFGVHERAVEEHVTGLERRLSWTCVCGCETQVVFFVCDRFVGSSRRKRRRLRLHDVSRLYFFNHGVVEFWVLSSGWVLEVLDDVKRSHSCLSSERVVPHRPAADEVKWSAA